MTDYNDGIITRDYRYYSREVIQKAMDAFEEKRLNKLDIEDHLIYKNINKEKDMIFTIRGRCTGFNSKILYFDSIPLLRPFNQGKTWANHMIEYRKNIILRSKLQEFLFKSKFKGMKKICVLDLDYTDCYTEETKQLLKKYHFIRSRMYDSIQQRSGKNR